MRELGWGRRGERLSVRRRGEVVEVSYVLIWIGSVENIMDPDPAK